jgi:hypothetical protein
MLATLSLQQSEEEETQLKRSLPNPNILHSVQLGPTIFCNKDKTTSVLLP